MRVAAIDCGTNSIRLLIADTHNAGLVDVVRTMSVVRLGEGIDRTGEFSEAALDRTFAATRHLRELIDQHHVEQVRFCATSASRDARNRQVFLDGVNEILGVTPEVISGEEEARLSFTGATSRLRPSDGPFVVVDIGGGSTEFVLGTDKVDAAISVDIGCVRMTERHMPSDPPLDGEVAATISDVDQAITRALEVIDVSRMRTLVAVAGTATTIAAAALDLPEYLPDHIDGAVVTRAQVQHVSDRFLRMTRAERAQLPYMHPGRVDVIAAGAIVLSRIMDRMAAEAVTVSEHDILDGIALSLTLR